MPLDSIKNTIGSRKTVITVLAAVTVLALYLVFASILIGHGHIDFFQREALGEVFVDTWHHLTRWEFDLTPQTIGYEGFYREGKVYTYFGPFPSFIRGGMEILFGRVQTDWSRISFLMAAAIFSVSVFFVYKNIFGILGVRSFFYPYLLTAAAVLSSSYAFLLSSAVVYHEVIIWALAWSMAGLALIAYCYNRRNIKLAFLLLISICAGFAFLSRTLTSLGILMVTSSVFIAELFKEKISASRYNVIREAASVTYAGNKRLVVFGLLPVIVSIGFMLTVNYYRWGSPLEFLPAKHHILFKLTPKRLEYFNSIKPVSGQRAIEAMNYYFIPHRDNFSGSFPFIKFLPKTELGFGPSLTSKDPSRMLYDYDFVEPGAPMTLFSPLLLIFAGIGLFAFFRYRFPLLIYVMGVSFFAPVFVIILWPGLTIRYSAEFVPLLVLLSSVGAATLVKNTRKHKSWLLRAFFLLVLFAGIFMTLNVIYAYKLYTWYVPQFYKLQLISAFQ